MTSHLRKPSEEPLGTPAGTPTSHVPVSAANSNVTRSEEVELSTVQNGFVSTPEAPLQDDIMQCARLGEVGLLQKMFGSGKYSAQYKDEEGITPLHWAAINNQYAACEFLIEAGADVNVRGGESGANPAMWAAQRCHYYVVNLLLQSGTDPLLVDGQGYNLLHLATIDGNAFLLVLLLHQDIPVDLTDPQGHTSLMWAAYKGFPVCVDLLLRWGANVNATDEKGLNTLHWALVKGSQLCIQKIIENGADRFAQTHDGKDPAMVAGEMRSTKIWHQALSECGYNPNGKARRLRLGLTTLVRDRKVAGKFFFLWPSLVLWVVITILAELTVYAAVPVALIAVFSLQAVVVEFARWGPSEYRQIHRTPFLAGLFAATLFWVGVRWAIMVLPATAFLHPLLNIVFTVCYGLTACFFLLCSLEDPGYVPNLASRRIQKTVIERLLRHWRFDEDSFCMQCMVRRPLRSKHCRRCGRCVAKHDHHCPWINNCVGNDNLRHFFLYMLFMDMGIIVFIRLVLAYIESLPPSPSNILQCTILPSTSILCDLLLRDIWTIILTFWAIINCAWITMLLLVQFVQISSNQTTHENMKGQWDSHSDPTFAPHIPHTPAGTTGETLTSALTSGSTNLGPEGAGILDGTSAAGAETSSLPPHHGQQRQQPQHQRERPGFFTQWRKLLGLDAIVGVFRIAWFGSATLTSSSTAERGGSGATDVQTNYTGRRSSIGGRRWRGRRKQNPFDRGIITNWRDFWWDDPGPYFGTRNWNDYWNGRARNCGAGGGGREDHAGTAATAAHQNEECDGGGGDDDDDYDHGDEDGIEDAVMPGDAALDGQMVSYVYMYEVPQRGLGGGGGGGGGRRRTRRARRTWGAGRGGDRRATREGGEAGEGEGLVDYHGVASGDRDEGGEVV